MILGISGRAGSGKTTLAQALVSPSDIYSFAGPLKRAVFETFGVGTHTRKTQIVPVRWENTPFWTQGRGGYMTYRELLQEFGMLFRRRNQRHWIDLLLNAADDPCDTVVIDDLRFPNEADAIRETGGIVIRLTRRGGEVPEHISETALDDYKHFALVVPDVSVSEAVKLVKGVWDG